MRWPAVLRSAALCAIACVHHDAPVPVANHLEPGAPDLTGQYWCSIDETGYDYPKYPCMIRRVGGQVLLAKLSGSQRFTGVVTPDGEGFKFTGKLYCPWGDCNQALHGAFVRVDHGELKGTFADDAMIVRLVRTPANAFGEAGYGGEGYGGDGYGDPWSLGGAQPGGKVRL
jgi:hypothetical protein